MFRSSHGRGGGSILQAIVPHTSPAYRVLVRSAATLIPVVAPLHPKLARGHRARTGAAGRLRQWAELHRDRGRPLVWFHAPSVGEGLQAQAVVEPLRQRHPDWQVAYTHFSPSAETFARKLDADVADYLPYDSRPEVTGVLDSLSPSAIVFVKLDLWPELATRAAARGIPVGLVAGTVSPVSGRTAWPWRSLTRPGYEAVTAAGAIAEEDAGRLIHLGVPADRITVTGDPRFDSVLRMVRTPTEEDPAEAWRTGGAALVAGSTWPADEQVVLEAFVRVRSAVPEARLILAPHEPTAAHLAGIRLLAQSLGLPSPRPSSEGATPAPLVVVDRLGVLARLYGAGAMAYVGGGFGRAGLHSVLEPAAWGIPVVHGPRWQNSREAGLLQKAGGGFSLPPGDAAARLSELWTSWLVNDSHRRDAGSRARTVVERGVGAAERSAQLVEQLIDD